MIHMTAASGQTLGKPWEGPSAWIRTELGVCGTFNRLDNTGMPLIGPKYRINSLSTSTRTVREFIVSIQSGGWFTLGLPVVYPGLPVDCSIIKWITAVVRGGGGLPYSYRRVNADVIWSDVVVSADSGWSSG